MSTIMVEKRPKKTKDLKLDERTALRFRRLGCSGLSAEKLIVKVLDVIDNHPEIKKEILNYN